MDLPINSVVAGIDWPPLPHVTGATRLGLLFQLEQSQWWSEEKLREHQFRQVRTLLQHCLSHVPYYRHQLAKEINPNSLSETQWQAIPILTREDVQRLGSKLHADNIPPGHGKLIHQRTSGSTGMPIETLGTEITLFFWNIFTLREHIWHRRDLSKKLAVIRYSKGNSAKPPHGFTSENWGRATEGVFNTGPSTLLDIFTPVEQQVEWLQRIQPDYLLTHPSVLQGIALHCLEKGINLPSLDEVRTISEALPDGLRALCRQAWDARLVDAYSTVELGYIALQCPEHEHYHVQSEGILLEVVDENGKPCSPGETGRVIVTNLHNYAQPLIRYEIGDFAELGEPCDCGRGLPVIKRILGRYRNLITQPDGGRHWPQLGIMNLHEIAPIKQFQAIQHSVQDIEIKLIMERPLLEAEKKALLKRFRENIGDVYRYTIREVDVLQRSIGGKYEEFISKV